MKKTLIVLILLLLFLTAMLLTLLITGGLSRGPAPAPDAGRIDPEDPAEAPEEPPEAPDPDAEEPDPEEPDAEEPGLESPGLESPGPDGSGPDGFGPGGAEREPGLRPEPIEPPDGPRPGLDGPEPPPIGLPVEPDPPLEPYGQPGTQTSDAPEPDPPAPPEDNGLQKLLSDFVQGRTARWDIYVERLDTGESASAQANVPANGEMISASLIKLFIAGAVYTEAAAGNLSLDGLTSDLQYMITVSDNDAANRLVRQLGGGDAAAGREKVAAFAQSIGCRQTRQNRLMLENNGTQNYTSAADCARALKRVYQGTFVNADYSGQILANLKAQTVNNRLPSQLPAGTTVAHKTGDLSGVSCGDVGIVYSPGATYVICVIVNDISNDAQTAGDIASLSRQVYDYFNG